MTESALRGSLVGVVRPYLALARLQAPIGIWLLMWPAWW